MQLHPEVFKMVDGTKGSTVPTLYESVAGRYLQTDLPHMLSYALGQDDPRRIAPPCSDDTAECRAEHYFGAWQDAFMCRIPRQDASSAAEDEISIDFLMLCPKPHWFNTGSHRAMMGVRYEGTQYVIAMEETHLERNAIFIGVIPGGVLPFPRPEPTPMELLSAAIYAATGFPLYPGTRKFEFHPVDGMALLASGCSPSEHLGEY